MLSRSICRFTSSFMNWGTGKSGSPRLHLMTCFPCSSMDRILGPILKAFSLPSRLTHFEKCAMTPSCHGCRKKRGRQLSFSTAFLLSCDLRDYPACRAGFVPVGVQGAAPELSRIRYSPQSLVPERFASVAVFPRVLPPRFFAAAGLAPSVPRPPRGRGLSCG